MFENEANEAMSVTGARYCAIKNQFFVPKLNDIDMNNMLFQQQRRYHMR